MHLRTNLCNSYWKDKFRYISDNRFKGRLPLFTKIYILPFLQARIDSHNKILYAKDVDQRTVTFTRAIEMGQEWQRRTKALILRSAMLKNGLIQVKCPQPLRSADDATPSASGSSGNVGGPAGSSSSAVGGSSQK